MDILTVNDRPGDYPPSSYYVHSTKCLPRQPEAAGELRCDVCVIGAGYTGLSTALHLAEKGFDVILLEANRIGWGASGRNGGQVHPGLRLHQDELEDLVGQKHAKELWNLAQRGVWLVRDLINRHEIECDWRDGIIHADLRESDYAHSLSYAEKMARDYGCNDIRPLDKDAIGEELGTNAYCGGLFYENGAHLHPLKYVLGLGKAAAKAGVRIFEMSRVTAIKPGPKVKVATDKASVKADYLVLGCNGYHGNLHGSTARHVMPINNYIIATEPLGEERAKALIRNNAAVYDSNFVVNYYRCSIDHRMLFGGGESYGFSFPKDIAGLVRKRMLDVFPQLETMRIDYAWGGTLGITMTRMPY
jgi:gamma-glutamylputrescine oxidase